MMLIVEEVLLELYWHSKYENMDYLNPNVFE